jgi:transposase
MIPAPTQVLLVVEAIDMRTGIDGLSQRIQSTLGRSPCDGTAYAFRNQRLNRIKLLIWDGSGVWLCHRRLHRGHFIWPTSVETVCTLTAKQWQWLIPGVDW